MHKRRALIFFLATLFGLGLAEGLLRYFAQNQLHVFFDPNYDTFWELRFLQTEDYHQDPLYSLFEYDPELGAKLRPNAKIGHPDGKISINSEGYRGVEIRNSQNLVLVFGDSMTFGPELADGKLWTDEMVQQNVPVKNLAIGGQGPDQMLLRLRQALKNNRPKLVIFALTDVGLSRLLLSMRDTVRPRFTLAPLSSQSQKQRLVFPQFPLPRPEEMRRQLIDKYAFRPYLWIWSKELWVHWKNRNDPQRIKELFPLAQAILLEAKEASEAAGARFLLVHLSRSIQMTSAQANPDLAEHFLNYLERQDSTWNILRTRPFFLQAKEKWDSTADHYGKEESKFVGKILTQFLRQTYAYQP